MIDFTKNPSQQNLPENLSLVSAQTPVTSFRGVGDNHYCCRGVVAVYFVLPYDVNANKGLAILLFVAILWFTEAIHITVTALMVPLLAVAFGIPDMTTKKRISEFF